MGSICLPYNQGPQVWDQTDGKITHFVVPTDTGGTISGSAKFLKEQNPDIQIWGVDAYGSVFKKYKETGLFDLKDIYPYIQVGNGEHLISSSRDKSITWWNRKTLEPVTTIKWERKIY